MVPEKEFEEFRVAGLRPRTVWMCVCVRKVCVCDEGLCVRKACV